MYLLFYYPFPLNLFCLRHLHHNLPFFRFNSLNRKPSQPHKVHIRQPFIRFYCGERHWLFQFLKRFEIHHQPCRIFRCRILVSFFNYFGNGHYFHAFIAVVPESEVAFLHRAQIITRRIVAHAVPESFTLFCKLVPAVNGWFGFD